MTYRVLWLFCQSRAAVCASSMCVCVCARVRSGCVVVVSITNSPSSCHKNEFATLVLVSGSTVVKSHEKSPIVNPKEPYPPKRALKLKSWLGVLTETSFSTPWATQLFCGI